MIVAYIEIILTAIALSMDAMAIAICEGLKNKKNFLKNVIIVAILFGLFQAIMPLIGYYGVASLKDRIADYDHFISFILLSIVGLKMIFDKSEESKNNSSILSIIILAIATSIDALIVGVSFSFNILDINIFIIITIIGFITFILSLLGGLFGKSINNIIGNKSEKIGGLILIIIAIKILVEHLFF